MSVHEIHKEITDVIVKSNYCTNDRDLETFIRNVICEIETDYYNASIKSIATVVTDSMPGGSWWTVTILFSFYERTIVDT